MKKIIFVFLFLFLFVNSTRGAMAEDMMIATDSAMATQSAPTKVEYNFVFPGILPDNPLYFLKTIRDRAVSLLINDKLKRAEFDLLASDKRLVAAGLLVNKNRDDLAITTLSKSNNYMDQVITSLAAAKKAGQNIDTVLHNTQTSIKKHQEEVLKMQKSIDKNYSSAFLSERDRLQKLGKAASKINPKK